MKKINFSHPLWIALGIIAIFFVLLINLPRKKKPLVKQKVEQNDTLYITEDQKLILFPSWVEADSVYGVEKRFTTEWCDLAQETQFP